MPEKYCKCQCHVVMGIICSCWGPACCPERGVARSELKPLAEKKKIEFKLPTEIKLPNVDAPMPDIKKVITDNSMKNKDDKEGK